MNKKELISLMAEKSSLTKANTENALNAFIETVEECLSNGDSIQLIGFGTFLVKERAARKGRNPRTKEEIEIPATKAPAFKPGKDFKEKINNK